MAVIASWHVGDVHSVGCSKIVVGVKGLTLARQTVLCNHIDGDVSIVFTSLAV